ncbi:hypothetical protein OC842_000395 [Tilletia horrida]|uniref:Uncharacterized protein n=1 Tax=Tilletia horrida TaxID=155126 RepID=A0AAN6GHN4_9BASI|nr:hypothetical protein OC842_000395 [Tilletia horrida]
MSAPTQPSSASASGWKVKTEHVSQADEAASLAQAQAPPSQAEQQASAISSGQVKNEEGPALDEHQGRHIRISYVSDTTELSWRRDLGERFWRAPQHVQNCYDSAASMLATSSGQVRNCLKAAERANQYVNGKDPDGLAKIVMSASYYALDFFAKLARRQTAAGKREAPGSAESLFADIISDRMVEFRGFLYEAASGDFIIPSEREDARSTMRFVEEMARTALDQLGLPPPPASPEILSVVPQQRTQPGSQRRPTMALAPISRWFADQLRQLHPETSSSTSDQDVLAAAMPFLAGVNTQSTKVARAYASQDLSSGEDDVMHLFLDELSRGHQARDQVLARYHANLIEQAQRLCHRAERIGGRSAAPGLPSAQQRLRQIKSTASKVDVLAPQCAVTMLQHIVIALCELGTFKDAAKFAELIAIILREGFENHPSPELQLRFGNAMAALAVLLRNSDDQNNALYAADEALRLLEPLQAGPSDEVPCQRAQSLDLSIAVLNLEIGLCELSIQGSHRPSTSEMLELGVRCTQLGIKALRRSLAQSVFDSVSTAAEAESLATTALKVKLAEALHALAKLRAATSTPLVQSIALLEEATTLYRSPGCNTDSSLYKKHFARALAAYACALSNANESVRAIEIAQEGMTIYDQHRPWYSYSAREDTRDTKAKEALSDVLGLNLLKEHEWERADAAFSRHSRFLLGAAETLPRLQAMVMIEKYWDAIDTAEHCLKHSKQAPWSDTPTEQEMELERVLTEVRALLGYASLMGRDDPQAAANYDDQGAEYEYDQISAEAIYEEQKLMYEPYFRELYDSIPAAAEPPPPEPTPRQHFEQCFFSLIGANPNLPLIEEDINRQAEWVYTYMMDELYILVLGWTGAAFCKRGEMQQALEFGERAAALARHNLGVANRQERILSSNSGGGDASTRKRKRDENEGSAGTEPAEEQDASTSSPAQDSDTSVANAHLLLARMLVLLAISHYRDSRGPAARAMVDEALCLMRDNSSHKMEGPTRKTALLVRAKLCEDESGEQQVKERMLQEAETIRFEGYLGRLCGSGPG